MSDHYWLNTFMQSLDFVLDLELDEQDKERLETARILIGWKLDGKITKANATTWGAAGLIANEKRFAE